MPAYKRQRVSDLIPSDPDLPPSAVVQKFATFYSHHEDLKLAACQAKLMPEMGAKLYRNPKVREIIDRKLLLIEVENAKLAARSKQLTADRLDVALLEEVASKKNGHVRVRAIELGYRRTGMIRDGEFYVAPDPAANKNAPSIYRASQVTVKRTMTATEEVTHTQAAAAVADPIFAVKEY